MRVGDERGLAILVLVEPRGHEVIHATGGPELAQIEPEAGRAALSPCELCAVEQALRLRDGSVGSTVTALSVGPPDLVAGLRYCLAMGVDDAYVVATEGEPFDGVEVGARVAQAARHLRVDLVLAGAESATGMHSTTAAAAAHFLSAPVVLGATSVTVSQGLLRATQRGERGDVWDWRCTLPMVCALTSGANEPRYVSVRRLRRWGGEPVAVLDVPGASDAAAQALERFGRIDLVSLGSPRARTKKTRALATHLSASDRLKMLKGGGAAAPGKAASRQVLEGDQADVGRRLVEYLEGQGFLTT